MPWRVGTSVSRAVILAAGLGERLVKGVPYPKPLKPVDGKPLIGRILHELAEGGVEDVALIIGHLGEVLREAVEAMQPALRVHFVLNDEYRKPNGTSLLKAADFVQGPTLLMMADHLWAPQLLQAVRQSPLPIDDLVLGVDRAIARCPDLEDATKVALDEEGRIQDISKALTAYDALDTGVFRISPALIASLQAVETEAGCSLSQGVAALAAQGRAWGQDVGDAVWVDVDTPETHRFAEDLLRRFGRTLGPAAS